MLGLNLSGVRSLNRRSNNTNIARFAMPMDTLPPRDTITRPLDTPLVPLVPPVVAVSPDIVAALSCGERETKTLAEALAVDFTTLIRSVVPGLPPRAFAQISAIANVRITQRMRFTAKLLLAETGGGVLDRLLDHRSDIARGWAAYVISELSGLSLSQRLLLLRTLAADDHFGVREWAWLAIRPGIVTDTRVAVAELAPWACDVDERVRRFACEVTRPRGIWCAHLPVLKKHPEIGLPILEPIRADRSEYVQLSVANWLSDASHSRPDWVRQLTHRWTAESPVEATRRIVKRARKA